ncbi:hypothetical protein BGX27_002882, partial [Mortierella sp. AM989]
MAPSRVRRHNDTSSLIEDGVTSVYNNIRVNDEVMIHLFKKTEGIWRKAIQHRLPGHNNNNNGQAEQGPEDEVIAEYMNQEEPWIECLTPVEDEQEYFVDQDHEVYL